jgi:CHASE3 domain sensor protein
MRNDDQLQQNISHTAGRHALKQIQAIVEQENKNDADTARALRWLLRYGWIALLLLAAILAHLMGVY